jgi:hypothetical protein
MSGDIVEFRKRGRERADLYRAEEVPRGPAKPARLEQQIWRIAQLIDEWEEMTGGSGHLSGLLVQARGTIDKIRPNSVANDLGKPSQPDVHLDIDPQPDVDRDVLERMYRDLGVYP